MAFKRPRELPRQIAQWRGFFVGDHCSVNFFYVLNCIAAINFACVTHLYVR
jgi:hypothetical protein